jgi:hypothetical protein
MTFDTFFGVRNKFLKKVYKKGGRELNASPFLVSQEVLNHTDKPSFHARAIYCLSQAHDVIMQQLTSIS